MWRADRRSALLTVLLLAASTVSGADPYTGLLWKISGEKNSVYLLGSVHMLRDSDFTLSDSIAAAYDDAEALVMELDMDDLDPLAVQSLLFTQGRLPEGKTLQQIMGPEPWALAAAAAENLGIDLAMLNQVKPWWAALTITQLRLARLGFDPAHGLEAYFARLAARDNKTIEGLETASYQVQLFDAMDNEQQIELLIKSLDDAATLDKDMSQLLSAWRAGRVDELAALQAETFEAFPALYGSLIRTRNENWSRSLARLLQNGEQDYLVVVGALHLVGQDSVVRSMERLGFEISRQ